MKICILEDNLSCYIPRADNFHKSFKLCLFICEYPLLVFLLVHVIEIHLHLVPVNVFMLIYISSSIIQISFGSWYDPAKQHLARVVFDVRQEGSAKKVITIRSALTIFNQISSPVDVKMTAGNGLEGMLLV